MAAVRGHSGFGQPGACSALGPISSLGQEAQHVRPAAELCGASILDEPRANVRYVRYVQYVRYVR